ncbi:MAG: ParB/RepB/Spo0J family partition protein [Desulfovibrio sp.]|nr:ParB/RepB/Spo0J family partition protein [Desulfovibrio sp.]
MSTSPKLGKGLNALLEDIEADSRNGANTEIAVELLKPNPWQPRHAFNEENLEELAQSIKNQGIIQPLLVRELADKSYQIIAGERRWRAARLAGLHHVPVFIKALSDEEVMTAALIENLQREDLNPMEEAHALKKLRDTLNLTQEQLSTKLGKSRSSVANALRLLQLSEQAQDNVRSGILSAGHARTLLAINNEDVAEEVRKFVAEKQLSVRETEDLVSNWKNTGLLPWKEDSQTEKQPNQTEKNNAKGKVNRKSALTNKLENILNKVLDCSTRVRGNEHHGKITIAYANTEELHRILLKLGANLENADE